VPREETALENGVDPARVHEAWMQIGPQHAEAAANRRQYLAFASSVMRSYVVDHARRKAADKRGGRHARVTLAGVEGNEGAEVELLALHELLEELAATDAELGRIAELRIFGGLTAHGSLGDHERALALFEEVLQEFDELVARHPRDATLRYHRGNALDSVGRATFKAVGPEASLPVFRDTLEALEELLVDHPGYRAAAAALVGIRDPYTQALVQLARCDEALEECEEGLSIADALIEAGPADLQVQRWRNLLVFNAACAHHRRAEADRAGATTPDAVRQDLLAAQEYFQACLDFYSRLRDEGRLMPREQFATIEGRLERVAAALEED